MNVVKAFKLSAVVAVLICTASAAFAAESEFSFSGYLRSGAAFQNGAYGYDGNYGLTSEKANAQHWTGRLGKEASQTYLESTLANTFTVEGGAWAKLFTTCGFWSDKVASDAQNNHVANGSNDVDLRLRQAYVEMGGLGFSPDTSFWVGRRFYHRQDIHIMDWYLLDFSGQGAGVENILGLGVSLGLVQAGQGSTEQAHGEATATSYVLQYTNKLVRIDAVETYKPKNGATEATDGQFVSLEFKPEKFFYAVPGESCIIAQYAKGGSAMNLWYGDRISNMQDSGKDINKKLYSYAIVATGTANVSDEFSLGFAAGYVDAHIENFQIGSSTFTPKGDISRTFAIVRPHYNISKNVAVEVECGYYMLAASKGDLTQTTGWGAASGPAGASWGGSAGLDAGQKSNWTAKITPALCLTLDNGFYQRPTLRLYGQYETVGKKVAGNSAAYNTRKSNISYGYQVEAWW